MDTPFVILTGASGVGKTTIARRIEELHPEVRVYRGDSIGFPPKKIVESYGPADGPGGPLQRAFALYWIGVIAPTLVDSRRPVLLEGSTRIAFLLEAVALHNIPQARILLIKCDDASRDHRLTHHRLQPELANEQMKGWSRYLHQEAVEAGCGILDTSGVPIAKTVQRVMSYLQM